MIRFESSMAREYHVLKGIVVPVGSKVSQGIPSIDVPSAESCLSAFKHLFGNIKRKKTTFNEEEDFEPIAKQDIQDDDKESILLEEEYEDSDDDVSEAIESEDDDE